MPNLWNLDGEYFMLGGIEFRTVPGNRCPGDLRLDWYNGRGWVPVPMELCAMLADFHGHLEQTRYPNGEGAEFHWRYLRRAYAAGWRNAGRNAP